MRYHVSYALKLGWGELARRSLGVIGGPMKDARSLVYGSKKIGIWGRLPCGGEEMSEEEGFVHLLCVW